MARNKIDKAQRLGNMALATFNSTVESLKAAAQLADDAHKEHTAEASRHLSEAARAREVRDSHLTAAEKIQGLLK